MRVPVVPRILAVAAVCAAVAAAAWAHPSSGIVVDGQGQVYFQDFAGDAIWKIDADGKLTKFSDKVGGHFLALDAEGSFARTNLKRFKRVTAAGVKPALIVAEGGAPIAVNSDGNLYSGEGSKTDGGLTRISPDGKQQPFAAELKRLFVTGLASGPEGALYLTCNNAVLKVKADGTVAKVAEKVEVKDCDEDIPYDPTVLMPALRGLAVDAKGTVYVAATGCHRVVKVTADGKVETVLKSERPWSPTGVAVSGENVYVLEYPHANARDYKGWHPRVRKLRRDGSVTTLATIPAKDPEGRPK